MNYNYTACCWFPTSSNSLILTSQFWQFGFESCWVHCSKCRILVFLWYLCACCHSYMYMYIMLYFTLLNIHTDRNYNCRPWITHYTTNSKESWGWKLGSYLEVCLKAMDSLGKWWKWKLIFFLLMQNCIGLYEPCRSKLLPFSGNNQKHTNVRSRLEHFAIGYVHNDNLPLGNIALQYMYVIPNNCRKVWWCFIKISCTFWRSRKKIVKFTKTILWL